MYLRWISSFILCQLVNANCGVGRSGFMVTVKNSPMSSNKSSISLAVCSHCNNWWYWRTCFVCFNVSTATLQASGPISRRRLYSPGRYCLTPIPTTLVLTRIVLRLTVLSIANFFTTSECKSTNSHLCLEKLLGVFHKPLLVAVLPFPFPQQLINFCTTWVISWIE